jgi:hypothetical protein
MGFNSAFKELNLQRETTLANSNKNFNVSEKYRYKDYQLGVKEGYLYISRWKLLPILYT